MMVESESCRKESSINFFPMKTGNEKREKVSPVNLSCNTEPGYSKNS